MELMDVEAARVRLAALSRLEVHLSFRISRLCKLLDNHAIKNLKHPDLNLTDYRILLVLDIFNEASAAELSRLMVIDRAQISRSVGALRKAEFLTERSDPGNKRRKLLSLTDKGRATLAEEEPFFTDRQNMFEDMLTREELSGLMVAIDKLSRHLAQDLDQPQAMPSSQGKLP
ncbi:winged helix DNA-binding protein [Epibacterium ulvae]|uniref:MarR family winged helix-turn-helix transcriptional regulator n=1 Tax=Epibacterium ulvae TaxID=1156985 RepID=UPI001BFC838A|nr:MarR family transcriptional regulator [Epibacterium ulvae]MBT8154274.1 winged helix DNA-binding protein [Epibacterium ulvae]